MKKPYRLRFQLFFGPGDADLGNPNEVERGTTLLAIGNAFNIRRLIDPGTNVSTGHQDEKPRGEHKARPGLWGQLWGKIIMRVPTAADLAPRLLIVICRARVT